MHEKEPSTGLVMVLALGAGSAVVVAGGCYWARKLLLGRRRDAIEDEPMPGAAANDKSTTGLDAELANTISNATSVTPATEVVKAHYLKPEEAKKRALFLFPGLVTEEDLLNALSPKPRGGFGTDGSIVARYEEKIHELLGQKIAELQKDGGNFENLMKLENAVDLCLELGLNESLVKTRYRVINNFKDKCGIKSKTPTIVTIRHLIRRIGVDNPFFVERAHLDNGIMEGYKGKEWLFCLGADLRRCNRGCEKALTNILTELERKKFLDCYVHGTTATNLLGIYRNRGVLVPSKSPPDFTPGDGGKERHDFGPGVYCFKGQLDGALSFAVDRCWPMEDRDGTLTFHNPALVIFPNPEVLERVHHVGQHAPFTDEELDKYLGEEYKDDFIRRRTEWTDTKGEKEINRMQQEEINWKDFLKLSRYYNRVPRKIDMFHGCLHDCQKTALTDICETPIYDGLKWEQYCFTDPFDLGEKRLFVEFNVDWNEWTDETTWPFENNDKAWKSAQRNMGQNFGVRSLFWQK